MIITGRMTLLILGIMLLLLGCGGGDSSESSETTQEVHSRDTETETSDTETDVPAEPDEVAEPEPLPLYPLGTLNPAEVTPDVPVTSKALFEAFYAWNGKEVTLTGYCYIPYMRDTITVEDELSMIQDLDSSDRLATIEFAEPLGELINKDQLITITGTVEYSWTGDIVIVDAVLHAEAIPAEIDMEISPYSCDGTTAMAVSEFANVFSAWIDKEITVEGYYHSTTTSTTDYGVTIRVDLGDPDDIYTKYVGCEMITEPPETMVDDRYGVQIRGTITGESFDMVALEECELLNR